MHSQPSCLYWITFHFLWLQNRYNFVSLRSCSTVEVSLGWIPYFIWYYRPSLKPHLVVVPWLLFGLVQRPSLPFTVLRWSWVSTSFHLQSIFIFVSAFHVAAIVILLIFQLHFLVEPVVAWELLLAFMRRWFVIPFLSVLRELQASNHPISPYYHCDEEFAARS